MSNTPEQPASHIDIVFDGPPGPECGRFVEVEDASGASINVGEWVKRDDGYDVLRLPDFRIPPPASEAGEALEAIMECGHYFGCEWHEAPEGEDPCDCHIAHLRALLSPRDPEPVTPTTTAGDITGNPCEPREDDRCPACGYTADDVFTNGDHHLCDGPGPAPVDPELPAPGEGEALEKHLAAQRMSDDDVRRADDEATDTPPPSAGTERED